MVSDGAETKRGPCPLFFMKAVTYTLFLLVHLQNALNPEPMLNEKHAEWLKTYLSASQLYYAPTKNWSEKKCLENLKTQFETFVSECGTEDACMVKRSSPLIHLTCWLFPSFRSRAIMVSSSLNLFRVVLMSRWRSLYSWYWSLKTALYFSRSSTQLISGYFLQWQHSENKLTLLFVSVMYNYTQCMQCTYTVTKIFLNMHDWNIHSLDVGWDDVYFRNVSGCCVSLHTDWVLRDMCMWTVVIFTPWIVWFILEWYAFLWSGSEWDGLLELPLWLKDKEKKLFF